MCLHSLDLIHAPKRRNKNSINGRKIQSLDIDVTLIHQSMYSSYIIIKKSPVIFWLDWQKYKSFPCLIVCMRFHKHTIMTHPQYLIGWMQYEWKCFSWEHKYIYCDRSFTTLTKSCPLLTPYLPPVDIWEAFLTLK